MGLFGGAESTSALIEGCYTSGTIPGRTIEKVIGLVEYTRKGVAGDVPKISGELFQSLLATAQEHGGNAVINVQVVSGSYQQQGSKWNVTYVIVYGDAVVLS